MPLSRVCLACMRGRVQFLTLHTPRKVIQNGNPRIEKAETDVTGITGRAGGTSLTLKYTYSVIFNLDIILSKLLYLIN